MVQNSGEHQLIQVVSPRIYKVLSTMPNGGWGWDFWTISSSSRSHNSSTSEALEVKASGGPDRGPDLHDGFQRKAGTVGRAREGKPPGWEEKNPETERLEPTNHLYIYNRKGKSPFENLHLLCSKFIFQAIHGGDLVRVPSFLPKVSEKFLDLGWFNDIFSDGMLWFVVFQQEWIGARKGIPVFLDSLGRK